MSCRHTVGVVVTLLMATLSLVMGRAPAHAAPGMTARVNFQSQFAPIPNGYERDYGLPFDSARGYGWVAPDSQAPVSMVANGKDRNRVSDQRLDTLMLLKEAAPPRWQMAVPAGSYDVTVSVGDYNTGANMRVVVEGTVAITGFKSTSLKKFTRATVRVDVQDGFLTLDAAGGYNTKLNYVDIALVTGDPPRIFTEVDPAPGRDGVPVTTSVVLTTSHSVDPQTMTSDNIHVIDDLGNVIPGNFNTDAAGGVISFTPLSALSAFTTYNIQTTVGVRDLDGFPFQELSARFMTGEDGTPKSSASFDRLPIGDVTGPTVVTVGPDQNLYAATAIGKVLRYTTDASGEPLDAPLEIDRWLYQRTILGLAFDPASTPANPILWVSHGNLGDDQPNYTGKVSVLTGANLEDARDVIVGLPRSVHDHMNNGIVFGPDGRLYLAQGAMTGFGAPDSYWGNVPEVPLSAAILQADVSGDPRFQETVNVDTSTGYDPFSDSAPVKVYASGLRNPYDLVWHSNGSLYAPVNESAGGNAPAGPGNIPPGLTNLPDGDDFLAKVAPARYYGHPNPSQGHYVLNGGNPTAAVDPWEVAQYPVGIEPDPDYEQPIINLGKHRSVNGIAEYISNEFAGALKGKLIAAEFSNGDDVIAMGLDQNGDVTSMSQVVSGLLNPIDVATTVNGVIYVAEFGNQPNGDGGKISLLKPTPGISKTAVGRVNFQPQSAPVPTGYVRDYGEAYNTENEFGWVAQDNDAPLSIVGNGRDTNLVTDQRLDTYVYMQYSGSTASGVTTPARWEHAVANGTYDVTVSVGDARATNSVHRITVEGTVAIDNYRPTPTGPFASNTVRVTTTDGKVTVDAAGGTNTKINYVNIDAVTFVPIDATPPTVSLAVTGTRNVDDTYASDVVVTATADDGPGTGVASISYRLDGGPFTTYGSPVTVSAAGPHTFSASATDAAGNSASATTSFAIDRGVPAVRFQSPHDFLGTGPRLVFSTVANDPTQPAKAVNVVNPGPKPLTVSALAVGGANAADFRLDASQPTSFTVAPGGSAPVKVLFQPQGPGEARTATLDVSSNDPFQPVASMPLVGMNPGGFEGGFEPELIEITRLLGYQTRIPLAPGETRLPAGDEVVSPFWVTADAAKPVQLIPLARYVTRNTLADGATGWYHRGGSNQLLYSFPGGSDPYGGENQKLLPEITAGRSTGFSPSGPFGIWSYNNEYSDDARNSSTAQHNFRFFPAKDPAGAVIPHTWIVGYDRGFNLESKNYDYQDIAYLLVNAEPEKEAAPALGATGIKLDFAVGVPGTVEDRDGQGTGFDAVQPNTAGDQYRPSLLHVDTAAGVLRVTSTSGTTSGAANTQVNALGSFFDGSLGAFQVSSRLVGPFDNINAGYEQQAIWFGPDQNNYFKVELENRNGVPTLIAFFEEQRGDKLPKRITAGPLVIPDLASATTVDLFITGDPATGSVKAAYRVNSDDPGAITPFGPSTLPKDVMRWFSRVSSAGILTSNRGSSTPIVGTYGDFAVLAG